MALPPQVAQYLRPYFPEWLLQRTQLEVRLPRLAPLTTFARRKSRWIIIGSAPAPGIIVIHPEYYRPSTATGLALIAHELCHQEQWRNIPDFLERYNAEEERRIRAGQGILGNKYEAECYARESAIMRDLIRRFRLPRRLSQAKVLCLHCAAHVTRIALPGVLPLDPRYLSIRP